MKPRYLLVLLLAGCATSDMVKIGEPKTVVVTWERERPKFCGSHAVTDGCSHRSLGYKTCTIWAEEGVPDAVLGHELRHCFGYEHEAAVRARDAKK